MSGEKDKFEQSAGSAVADPRGKSWPPTNEGVIPESKTGHSEADEPDRLVVPAEHQFMVALVGIVLALATFVFMVFLVIGPQQPAILVSSLMPDLLAIFTLAFFRPARSIWRIEFTLILAVVISVLSFSLFSAGARDFTHIGADLLAVLALYWIWRWRISFPGWVVALTIVLCIVILGSTLEFLDQLLVAIHLYLGPHGRYYDELINTAIRNGALSLAVDLLASFGLLRLRRGEHANFRVEVKAAKDYIRGTVRGFQARTETTVQLKNQTWNLIVWTFRIERRDSHGNRLQPVPVEMRGFWFGGFLNEGDEVEVCSPDWREGATIYATEVRNVTTQSKVYTIKAERSFKNILISLIPIIVPCILGLLVLLWWAIIAVSVAKR
jgi:hypothetical protein